jgi:hypothetical protein
MSSDTVDLLSFVSSLNVFHMEETFTKDHVYPPCGRDSLIFQKLVETKADSVAYKIKDVADHLDNKVADILTVPSGTKISVNGKILDGIRMFPYALTLTNNLRIEYPEGNDVSEALTLANKRRRHVVDYRVRCGDLEVEDGKVYYKGEMM